MSANELISIFVDFLNRFYEILISLFKPFNFYLKFLIMSAFFLLLSLNSVFELFDGSVFSLNDALELTYPPPTFSDILTLF